MHEFRFDWDKAKNQSNQKKHGISFQEATRVFADPLYVSIPERIADGEQRWQTFGRFDGQLLLMVAHTTQEFDGDLTVEVIRIITARRATKRERRKYEERKNG